MFCNLLEDGALRAATRARRVKWCAAAMDTLPAAAPRASVVALMPYSGRCGRSEEAIITPWTATLRSPSHRSAAVRVAQSRVLSTATWLNNTCVVTSPSVRATGPSLHASVHVGQHLLLVHCWRRRAATSPSSRSRGSTSAATHQEDAIAATSRGAGAVAGSLSPAAVLALRIRILRAKRPHPQRSAAPSSLRKTHISPPRRAVAAPMASAPVPRGRGYSTRPRHALRAPDGCLSRRCADAVWPRAPSVTSCLSHFARRARRRRRPTRLLAAAPVQTILGVW